MVSRRAKKKGKIAERGGRISEGRAVSGVRGWKELERRKRIGGREIDSLLQRGDKIMHFENTKSCVTKPKMEEYWEKYKQTRIASGANTLGVKSPCITDPAKKFAKNKGIRIF